MSKKCARCEKSVYPVEELRCLDKTWHKGCFRCFECGMMLNMKNYKGYAKQPYCEAHYPKVKHTQVADTPENARLAQNTKLQSQARYHEEFEKLRGTKITVVDDPETVRARKNMEISSQVTYTGLMNKHADMEARRPIMEQGDNQPQDMTGQRAFVQEVAPPPPQPQPQEEHKPSPYASRNQGQTTVYNAGGRGKGPKVKTSPKPEPAPAPQQHQQHHQPQHHQHHQPQKKVWGYMRAKQGPRYNALYDYERADADEVSFREGDIIVNTESIDEGWMTGTVQRTGQTGMLPANYVQRIS